MNFLKIKNTIFAFIYAIFSKKGGNFWFFQYIEKDLDLDSLCINFFLLEMA